MTSEAIYKAHDKHLVSIDSIIFGFSESQLKLLLIQRKFEPRKGYWSLMGGFVKHDENIDDAAHRILEELTGLKDIYLEQLYTYGDVKRDPGARVISIAYFALINIEQYNFDLGEKHGACWFNFEDVPELIFDHNEMVTKAWKRLKRRTKIQPVGFELLPEKFTLTQLQDLYEAIHQQKLDKRNFRKKILSMDVLEKLEEKDKRSSRRGAYLYRFNKEKYDQLVQNGVVLEFK